MTLEELKALEAAATPGPWLANIPHASTMAVPVILTESGAVLGNTTHHGRMREDALFIAAARAALPRLIAVAEAAAQIGPTDGVHRVKIRGWDELKQAYDALVAP